MIAEQPTMQSEFQAAPICEIRSASNRTPTVGELAEKLLRQTSTGQVSRRLPLDVVRTSDDSLTTPLARSALRSALPASKSHTSAKIDQFDHVRDQRVALLARRFADSIYSGEDRARFAILTEQARALRPKVSSADIAMLNEQASQIQEVSDEMDQITAEFGL